VSKTLNQALNRWDGRGAAALHLEAEANVSLSGIAQALGYFDQAHFTRDFKRATGVNPGHYRLCIGAGAEAPA